jgi:signal recognition particle receptor subunit beta
MVLVNYAGKEINAKLVYYGPGLSGKTTNLEYIYTSVPASHRGKMVSMKTKTERTLFFDFLPLDLGELGGYRTRFLLYTVPGQVYYNATRKLVLKGVDAVVFVADSKRAKMDENRESLQNLRENLKELGLELGEIPWVLQYNKRDLPDAASLEELQQALNIGGDVPTVAAVASRGEGVFETFKEVSKLLLRHLSRTLGSSVETRAARPAPPPPRPVRVVEAPRPEEPAAAVPPPAAEEAPRLVRLEASGAPSAAPAPPRTFAPTILPHVEPPARFGEAGPASEETASSVSDSGVSHQGARAENGRARNGLFGWLRRPRSEAFPEAAPAPEAPPDAEEPFEAAPPSSLAGEVPRSDAGPWLSEHSGEADDATAAPRKPLEILRLGGASEEASVALARNAEVAREITIPVAIPEGCRQMRIVLTLQIAEEADGVEAAGEDAREERLAY